jgi:hypothetical protein|tara:strand:- start:143 stop:649 length:507 start_codon:yes stop_codon:yes gene_type:complete
MNINKNWFNTIETDTEIIHQYSIKDHMDQGNDYVPNITKFNQEVLDEFTYFYRKDYPDEKIESWKCIDDTSGFRNLTDYTMSIVPRCKCISCEVELNEDEIYRTIESQLQGPIEGCKYTDPTLGMCWDCVDKQEREMGEKKPWLKECFYKYKDKTTEEILESLSEVSV